MTVALFTYDEVDAILRGDGHNDYVGISAIDGLIASTVAGPAHLEPEDWLPQIFGRRAPIGIEGTTNHRMVQTILDRHREDAEILAERPEHYLPMFMQNEGDVLAEDWAAGFMLGVSLRTKAWTQIMLSDFRATLMPILSVHPLGRKMAPDVPDAELNRIKASAHHTIANAVVALYRHCGKARSASRRLARLRAKRP